MSSLNSIGQLSLESFNNQVIQATIEKCSQIHNPKIVETIKQNWIANLNRRLNTSHDKHPPTKRALKTEDVPKSTTTTKYESASDDEFLDADVESVHPAELKSQAGSSNTKPVTETKPVVKDTKEDKPDDEDTDESISDISDLDDEEPEYNDMVIGMLDKITRPSSKKFGPPLWKLRLKYGIMQINNTEIPFDTLEGEFEF